MRLSRAHAVAAGIERALAPFRANGDGIHVVGAPEVRVASWDVVGRDLRTMLPLLALVVAAVPLLFFGSPGAIVFPLALAALTTAVTLLAHRLFAGPLSALEMLLVPLIWSVSTLDAMHVYSRVRRRGPGHAASLALPCLLTSLTTAAGLGALAVQGESRLLASFGLWGAVGTCIAYALTFTLGRPMLGTARSRRRPPRWPSRFAAAVVRLSERHRMAALAGWGTLLLAAAVGAAFLHVEIRYPEVFAADEPAARDMAAVRDALGTDLMPLEICLEPTDEHGRLPLALANAVLAVSHYLHTLPETRAVLPRDLLDADPNDPRMHQRGSLEEALRNLAKDPQVAPWVRFDLGAARVQAHFAPHPLARREEIQAWLRHFGATMLAHHRLTLAGPAASYEKAERRGARGALLGGMLSLLAMAAALGWAFRRARVFVAAIAGNLAPMLLVLGLMGALRIPWSLAMLPLPAVLLGLAVDDTIHLLWPLRKGKADLARGALRSGPPVLATTAVLVGSVATLALSALTPNRELGLLLGAGLVLALGCDLSLVPALLAGPRCSVGDGGRVSKGDHAMP